VKPTRTERDGLTATASGSACREERKPDAHNRVNSLDGMRTIAVFAVMMVHAGVPGAELGWLGVDVFFVLSGFLITTLLCSESRKNGNISLPKFWARRFLRLMPAYWMYVGTLTVWMLLRPQDLSAASGWRPATYIGSLWGYFVNYAPKGGIWSHQFLTVHLWSLAVEEQFYFVWPFVAYFAFRLRRPWLVAWLIVAVVLTRRAFASTGDLGTLLLTRGIGIVLGCAVAMTLATGSCPHWLASTRLRSLIIALTALVVILLTIAHRQGALTEETIHAQLLPCLGVLFVAIVAMLWYGPADRLTSILSSRLMVYLGQISYGLYLYHITAQRMVWGILTPALEGWNRYLKFGARFSLYVGLTVLIASASYHLVERRFLLLKNRLR
jgi:peptidoglycan/LPS O-acetylase OafA/YrhL